ncbi:hypothetical protein PFISCL1PPCAC_3429, partial [Pristionchus fissidentatus]
GSALDIPTALGILRRITRCRKIRQLHYNSMDKLAEADRRSLYELLFNGLRVKNWLVISYDTIRIYGVMDLTLDNLAQLKKEFVAHPTIGLVCVQLSAGAVRVLEMAEFGLNNAFIDIENALIEDLRSSIASARVFVGGATTVHRRELYHNGARDRLTTSLKKRTHEHPPYYILSLSYDEVEDDDDVRRVPRA